MDMGAWGATAHEAAEPDMTECAHIKQLEDTALECSSVEHLAHGRFLIIVSSSCLLLFIQSTYSMLSAI